MFSQIKYEIAKFEQDERLKRAEQAHLARVAKSASRTKPKRKWTLKFYSR